MFTVGGNGWTPTSSTAFLNAQAEQVITGSCVNIWMHLGRTIAGVFKQ